jgi:hypothetical protein
MAFKADSVSGGKGLSVNLVADIKMCRTYLRQIKMTNNRELLNTGEDQPELGLVR